jgi:DNA-binding LacI/PurR family transcriptional regulator
MSTFAELDIPLAAYDVDASGMHIDSAFGDDVYAGFELTKALIEQGYKNIIFIGGNLNSTRSEPTSNYDPCTVSRADGYRLAMKTLGDLEPRIFHAATRTEEGIRPMFTHALKEVPECAAVISEFMSILDYVKESNIKVACWADREDINDPWPECLAAVAVNDFDAMGTAASEMLLGRIQYPDQPVQRRLIKPEILIKEEK